MQVKGYHYYAAGSYRVPVRYQCGALQQVIAYVKQSSFCYQEISYNCRNSRLITGTSAKFGWWVDRNGNAKNFWGGVNVDKPGCACGVTGEFIISIRHRIQSILIYHATY